LLLRFVAHVQHRDVGADGSFPARHPLGVRPDEAPAADTEVEAVALDLLDAPSARASRRTSSASATTASHGRSLARTRGRSREMPVHELAEQVGKISRAGQEDDACALSRAADREGRTPWQPLPSARPGAQCHRGGGRRDPRRSLVGAHAVR
jgi:hypothetical protein